PSSAVCTPTRTHENWFRQSHSRAKKGRASIASPRKRFRNICRLQYAAQPDHVLFERALASLRCASAIARALFLPESKGRALARPRSFTLDLSGGCRRLHWLRLTGQAEHVLDELAEQPQVAHVAALFFGGVILWRPEGTSGAHQGLFRERQYAGDNSELRESGRLVLERGINQRPQLSVNAVEILVRMLVVFMNAFIHGPIFVVAGLAVIGRFPVPDAGGRVQRGEERSQLLTRELAHFQVSGVHGFELAPDAEDLAIRRRGRPHSGDRHRGGCDSPGNGGSAPKNTVI